MADGLNSPIMPGATGFARAHAPDSTAAGGAATRSRSTGRARGTRASGTPAPRAAFTLVEILIVVFIMAIIAAVALPKYQDSSRQGDQQAFVAQTQAFVQAARRYMNETGEYLESSATGVCPSGWEPYIDVATWKAVTPIGGRWDFERDSFGIKSGFGVHFESNSGTRRDDAYMLEIDRLFDDGNLATGRFRKIAADRYYFILEE